MAELAIVAFVALAAWFVLAGDAPKSATGWTLAAWVLAMVAIILWA
jgi:hypothetical protein